MSQPFVWFVLPNTMVLYGAAPKSVKNRFPTHAHDTLALQLVYRSCLTFRWPDSWWKWSLWTEGLSLRIPFYVCTGPGTGAAAPSRTHRSWTCRLYSWWLGWREEWLQNMIQKNDSSFSSIVKLTPCSDCRFLFAIGSAVLWFTSLFRVKCIRTVLLVKYNSDNINNAYT